jgi:L-alanine-DL-glutamate epimerase-like enolase superfamily enzyme
MSFQTPRIRSIELTPIYVPFKESVRQSMASAEGGLGMALKAEEAWLGEDFVICRLMAKDGHTGLGEVFVYLPETGTTPNQIIDIIQNHLAKYVLGSNPFEVEKINQKMEINVARNEVAKGLLDMACYDLMGQIAGKPAYQFMGEKAVNELHLTALIPLTDMGTMKTLAQMAQKAGYRSFRYKLGKGVKEDRDISEMMRSTLGPEARLRVDYNQAYSPQEAVKAIKGIEPFKIDVAEQPVSATDFLGMRLVQKKVKTPLMAHESCFTLQDIHTLTELKAIGAVGVNSERPGGVSKALKAIAFAKSRGMGVVLHNQPLGISSAMQIHLGAVSYPSLGYDMELYGHVMLEDDLISNRLDYHKGIAKVPEQPGLGVTLDEEALKKYAIQPTITITN